MLGTATLQHPRGASLHKSRTYAIIKRFLERGGVRVSPRKKTSAQQKKRTTKKSASTIRSAKSSTPKKPASQANKRHSSSTVKPSSNKPRPVGKAGSKRKKQSADTLMNTFVFGIVVFLALCAINLIGTTEQIEEPPTQSVTSQVGDPKDFFDTLGPIAAEYKSYGLYPVSDARSSCTGKPIWGVTASPLIITTTLASRPTAIIAAYAFPPQNIIPMSQPPSPTASVSTTVQRIASETMPSF